MGLSKNRGTPKWMVYNGKPYEQMDDLGVPIFLETPKSIIQRFGVSMPSFFRPKVDERPSCRWWWTRQELPLLWIKRCGSISRPGRAYWAQPLQLKVPLRGTLSPPLSPPLRSDPLRYPLKVPLKVPFKVF